MLLRAGTLTSELTLFAAAAEVPRGVFPNNSLYRVLARQHLSNQRANKPGVYIHLLFNDQRQVNRTMGKETGQERTYNTYSHHQTPYARAINAQDSGSFQRISLEKNLCYQPVHDVATCNCKYNKVDVFIFFV